MTRQCLGPNHSLTGAGSKKASSLHTGPIELIRGGKNASSRVFDSNKLYLAKLDAPVIKSEWYNEFTE